MMKAFKAILPLLLVVGVTYYFVASSITSSQDRQDLKLCQVDNEERVAINVQYKAAYDAFERTEQAFRTLSNEIESAKADRQLIESADDLVRLRDEMQLLNVVDCKQLVYET